MIKLGNKMKLFFSLLSCMLFCLGSVCGQNTESIRIDGKRGSQTIYLESDVRAIVIRAAEPAFNSLEVAWTDTAIVPAIDEHYWPSDGLYHSNPVVFEQARQTIVISGLEPGNAIELILIKWEDDALPLSTVNLRAGCDKPEMITQQEWRAGLPDPDYERIHNIVRNIILHHSATSNSLTNYTDIVRSIYTYHTQVNGWSDMGYNYLIAPDGSIFAGRDAGDLIYEDEVLGAHFCSSNTGTLGICLLGTFTNTAPTEAAIVSLNRLLAWKTAKDSLSPFGVNPHALNQNLGVIAAHRHGCATLCPGNEFLKMLASIKHISNGLLEDCGIFLDLPEQLPYRALAPRPNPVTGNKFNIKLPLEPLLELRLTDINGRQIPFKFNQLQDNELQIIAEMGAGMYLLVAVTKSAVYTAKLVRIE